MAIFLVIKNNQFQSYVISIYKPSLLCVLSERQHTLFCGRANNRIQVIEKNGQFIREIAYETEN